MGKVTEHSPQCGGRIEATDADRGASVLGCGGQAQARVLWTSAMRTGKILAVIPIAFNSSKSNS